MLAQDALFDLVRTARLVWSDVLELARLVPDGELSDAALAAGSKAVRHTPRLSAAMDEMLADPDPPANSSPGCSRDHKVTAGRSSDAGPM